MSELPKKRRRISISTPLTVTVVIAVTSALGIWLFAPAGPGIRTAVEIHNQTTHATPAMRVVGPSLSVDVPAVEPGSSRRVTLVDPKYGDILLTVPSANVTCLLLGADAGSGTTGMSGTIVVDWTGETPELSGPNSSLGTVSARSLRFGPSRGPFLAGHQVHSLVAR